MNRQDIFEEINRERLAQHQKWNGPHDWGEGDCSSPLVGITTKVTVLTEELGEVARAVLDSNNDQLKTELIQVAAVAAAILEGL